MARREQLGAAVEPSLVARIADGLRYALTGARPDEWFGPSDPLTPAVPADRAEQAGVAGRQFDYRTGYNVGTQPRQNEPITFETLRALADSYDLLRLVIETRKDQVCALPWSVQPRKKGAKPDARCEQATAFLRQPDREHGWEDWLRMLLEDLFVIDAPAVYIRRTVGGELWALEPIDGSTIKRVIDATGRTPADGPAYQQVLKGVPAVDYSRDELIYKPRNVRTHKVYGMSPVEQLINTVNTALRRQMFTLSYFTEGSVPDALAGVPAEWSTEQIKTFQDYWDMLMEDALAQRRRLKFVPGEIAKNFHETKQPPLKDQFDEWLARVVCYCFSIDATPFVAQVNRAVAETTREQSLSEGLASVKQWIKSLVDRVLLQCFGFADLEFAWQQGQIVDPVKRAQVHKTYVDAKVLHPDEVRADLGLDALTPEQKADMMPPPPVMPGAAIDDGTPPPKKEPPPPEKVEKAALTEPINLTVNLPTINVHPPEIVVDVAGTTVHATIEAAAAPDVRIEQPITVAVPEQPAPVINVTTPEPIVNFEAQMPAQAAPIVKVENVVQPAAVEVRVTTPPRRTDTTVERDDRGEIARMTQIEKDA